MRPRPRTAVPLNELLVVIAIIAVHRTLVCLRFNQPAKPRSRPNAPTI